MIAGCYVLDLYCDDEKAHPLGDNMETFTAELGSTARQQARRAGWTGVGFGRIKQLCPKCSKKKRKKDLQQKVHGDISYRAFYVDKKGRTHSIEGPMRVTSVKR